MQFFKNKMQWALLNPKKRALIESVKRGGDMRRILILLAMACAVPAANAELVLSSFSVSFFNQKVDTTASQNVFIQNSSNQTVNVNVTNTCVGSFEVYSECDSPLGPFQSCSLSVSYDPRQAGNDSCNISITDDAGDFEMVNVNGTATN
jgi:Abnormal spindle-like microcephaly-assoc'd, ASPM-SPD-2-Hydin